jgi:hypothetical protein
MTTVRRVRQGSEMTSRQPGSSQDDEDYSKGGSLDTLFPLIPGFYTATKKYPYQCEIAVLAAKNYSTFISFAINDRNFMF